MSLVSWGRYVQPDCPARRRPPPPLQQQPTDHSASPHARRFDTRTNKQLTSDVASTLYTTGKHTCGTACWLQVPVIALFVEPWVWGWQTIYFVVSVNSALIVYLYVTPFSISYLIFSIAIGYFKTWAMVSGEYCAHGVRIVDGTK